MKVPDGFPIGVQADGRIVVLYLAAEPWPDAFRTFLRAHVPLLQSLPQWTLRIVFPRRFGHAHDAYQTAVHEELESSLTPATDRRPEALLRVPDRPPSRRTATPQAEDSLPSRHQDVQRASLRRPVSPLDQARRRGVQQPIVRRRSPGRWRAARAASNRSSCHTRTVISLPWLASRVRRAARLRRGLRRETTGGTSAARRSQPRASTPWPSRERSVVM